MAVNDRKIRIRLHRKGIFFTFIAIGLVSLLVYSFIIHTGYIYRDSMFVIETRINTIGDFIKDVETDINRGFYISSFRSLLAIENFITSNNSFIQDINSVFEEALINATIMNESSSLIENASFTDWMVKIQEEAAKIDIIINFQTSNLTINQSDPWTIDIGMDILFNITDNRKTASWLRLKHISTNIDITGLEDPVYSLNTYGMVTNQIIKANQTNFDNINVLKNHIINSYYIASDRAPSFLMRLEGNLSNSTLGIESIVNFDKLVIQGLGLKTASAVDYIYFSNLSISSCQINETYNKTGYSWFRLDDADSYHLSSYQVNCI